MRRFLILAAAAVATAGCGSSSHRDAAPATPKLPRVLAQRLASESDAVAAAVARGDGCGAKQAAAQLRADANASIGRIPAAYRESLSSGVNTVVAQVPPCKRAPAVTAPAETSAKHDKERAKHGNEKKRRKDHEHGKHEGDG